MSENTKQDKSIALRNALGMFATGVAIVIARRADGVPVGLTINSFNSVSLSPPLIVWSMSKHLNNLPVFEACDYYSINVLSAQQQGLSQLFASRIEDKFSGLMLDQSDAGVPLLQDCCARFVCRNTSRHPGGDHTVFLSEVVEFERSVAPLEPLVFFGGTYRALVAVE